MDNVELMYIIDPRDDLLEELAGFILLESRVGDNVVE